MHSKNVDVCAHYTCRCVQVCCLSNVENVGECNVSFNFKFDKVVEFDICKGNVFLTAGKATISRYTEESTTWRCNGFLAQYNSLQIFTYSEQISVVFCYEPAIEFTVLKIQDFKKVVEVLWLCNEESVILADSSTIWYLCLQCYLWALSLE
jgi:hypothetical protein